MYRISLFRERSAKERLGQCTVPSIDYGIHCPGSRSSSRYHAISAHGVPGHCPIYSERPWKNCNFVYHHTQLWTILVEPWHVFQTCSQISELWSTLLQILSVYFYATYEIATRYVFGGANSHLLNASSHLHPLFSRYFKLCKIYVTIANHSLWWWHWDYLGQIFHYGGRFLVFPTLPFCYFHRQKGIYFDLSALHRHVSSLQTQNQIHKQKGIYLNLSAFHRHGSSLRAQNQIHKQKETYFDLSALHWYIGSLRAQNQIYQDFNIARYKCNDRWLASGMRRCRIGR